MPTTPRSTDATTPELLSLRPQALMLVLLGDHVHGRNICVFSGSLIDALARLNVSEHASRSTLTRMVQRGLLRRQRHGRRMYFGLTPRSNRILEDGQERIWKTGAVNDEWNGTWTLLGFSLPESWRSQRHELRSQLAWAGFGPLQGGLWIAPGHVAVEGVVAGLGLESHVRVFRARADELTDIGQMIGDAYDLGEIAARYQQFLARWQEAAETPTVADPLAARLSIVAEWLQAIRRDPRLPAQHLPPDWPAAAAQRLFHELEACYDKPARAIASVLLDTVPDQWPADAG
jgi:phenylacetic acid degradation operon negative regulatory protein